MNSRTTIINAIALKYKFKTYLEIGVRDTDDNFNKILVNSKDGVDPAPIKPIEYVMTSDEFFLKYGKTKKYDLIFVDGLHTSEQVYLDIKNSVNCLNDGGFIIVHDCNPPTEFHARTYSEYLKSRGEWNGDVYNGFIKIKNELVGWDSFVVDCDFGCGVITNRNLGVTNIPSTTPSKEIDWAYFNSNRVDLLSLISYDEFLKII